MLPNDQHKRTITLGHASDYTLADAMEMLRTAAAILEYSEDKELKLIASKIDDDLVDDFEDWLEQEAIIGSGDPYADVRTVRE